MSGATPFLLFDDKLDGALPMVNMTRDWGGVFKEIHIMFTDQNNKVSTVPLYFHKFPDFDTSIHLDRANADKADIHLKKIATHNIFLSKLVTFAVKEGNGRIDGGEIRTQPCPDSYVTRRAIELERRKNDPEVIKAAIKYLAEVHCLYLYKDYVYEDAITCANDEAFKMACPTIPGKYTIKLEGQPPSKWDGVSKTDSKNTPVIWKPAIDHFFDMPRIVAIKS